jgi:hypothetical protein
MRTKEGKKGVNAVKNGKKDRFCACLFTMAGRRALGICEQMRDVRRSTREGAGGGGRN